MPIGIVNGNNYTQYLYFFIVIQYCGNLKTNLESEIN